MARRHAFGWLVGVLCGLPAWAGGGVELRLDAGLAALQGECATADETGTIRGEGRLAYGRADRPVPLRVALQPHESGSGVVEVRPANRPLAQPLAIAPVTFHNGERLTLRMVVPASNVWEDKAAGYRVCLRVGRRTFEQFLPMVQTKALALLLCLGVGQTVPGWVDQIQRTRHQVEQPEYPQLNGAYAYDETPATLAPADAVLVDGGGAAAVAWLTAANAAMWVQRGGRLVLFDPAVAAGLPWLDGMTAGEKRVGEGSVLIAPRPTQMDSMLFQQLFGGNFRLRPAEPSTSTLSQLTQAMGRFAPPRRGLLVWFALASLVLLLPLWHRGLRRAGRAKLAWITLPLPLAIVAGATYALGVRMYPRAAEAVTATMAYANAGEQTAQAVSTTALCSPRSRRSPILLPFGTGLAVEPTLVAGNVRNAGPAKGPEPASALTVASDADLWSLPDLRVPAWSVRRIAYEQDVNLGRSVKLDLALTPPGRLTGTITNGLPRPLRQPVLMANLKAIALATDVPAGARLPVDLTLSSTPTSPAELDQLWSGSRAPAGVSGIALTPLLRVREPMVVSLLAWMDSESCPLPKLTGFERRRGLMGLQVDAPLGLQGALDIDLPVLRVGQETTLEPGREHALVTGGKSWAVHLPRPAGAARVTRLVFSLDHTKVHACLPAPALLTRRVLRDQDELANPADSVGLDGTVLVLTANQPRFGGWPDLGPARHLTRDLAVTAHLEG